MGERTIRLGMLQRIAPGESLSVRPVPGRGKLWIGGLGVAAGELIFIGGGTLFFTERDKGGCGSHWSTSNSGCTIAKLGLIGGAAVGALGGAYWGLYYRDDDVRVSVQRSF